MSAEKGAESRPGFVSILKEKELWISVVLPLLYCFRPLFLHETFFYRDIFRHSLPRKHLFTELIRSGQLPLWDPYLFGGQPFIGNVNNVVLHPSNLLYLFLSPLTALNIGIVLHMMLGGVAFYILARILGFHRISSAAGSIIFMLCGYSLSLIQFLGHQSALPLIPLALLFWHLYLEQRQTKWFVFTALTVAIQVLSGAPEINLITLFLLGGWSLTYDSKDRLKNLTRWIALCFCVAGLSAIQILPTLEMLHYSSRSMLDYQDFTAWSVHPKRFPEMMFAHFLGRTDALAWSSYWGNTIEGHPYTYILSLYFGFIAIVFSVCGIASDDSSQLPRAVKIFFCSAIFPAIFLAMGKYLPGFQFLYRYVPLIHFFRYPVKFLAITILPVTMFAVHGVEMTIVRKTISNRLLQAFVAFAVLLLAFAASFYFSDRFASALQHFFFGADSAETREGLQNSFTITALLWLAVTLLVISFRLLKTAAWLSWMVLPLLILDFSVAGAHINPTADRSFFEQVPPIVSLIKNQIGNQRLFRDEVPEIYRLRAPSNDVVWQNVWDLQILNYYTAALYDIPLIFHKNLDAMAQKSEVDLTNAITSLPWDRRIPLLSAGAVSLILTDQAMEISGVKLLARLKNSSNLPFYLYRNEKAASPVLFTANAILTKDHETALKEVLRPDYDSRATVVLETAKEFQTHLNCSAQIQTLQSNANSSALQIQNPCSGFLVFSEASYPGWHAYVDHKEVEFMNANYLFTAIYLPAGSHHVERHYRPLSFWFGAAISFLCLFASIFSLFNDRVIYQAK